MRRRHWWNLAPGMEPGKAFPLSKIFRLKDESNRKQRKSTLSESELRRKTEAEFIGFRLKKAGTGKKIGADQGESCQNILAETAKKDFYGFVDCQ